MKFNREHRAWMKKHIPNGYYRQKQRESYSQAWIVFVAILLAVIFSLLKAKGV